MKVDASGGGEEGLKLVSQGRRNEGWTTGNEREREESEIGKTEKGGKARESR